MERDADASYALLRFMPWHKRLQAELEIRTDRIRAAQVIARAIVGRGGASMSKLAAISDRIKEKKVAHDAKADEWARRLDDIDRREPGAFAAGDAVIAERDEDLKEMEATMRSLSNLPLAGSGSSQGGSG